MARLHWKERYGKDGICDFKANRDFYFKWLLAKTCSCFYIKNLPDTVDEFYVKSNLLTDGDIGITEFDGKLYAVIGAPGGEPDEYYRPTLYTVANPKLGSKIFTDGKDGIIIYNSPIDAYISGGLYGLIDQTATLLADNIVSINCCQINTRVTAAFTADSDAQALAGEAVLKSIYAGHPYKILRSDLIDKISVNPISTAGVSQNLTELVELHNYIISNYFQSIGIKSNDIRKKAHVLQEEIDSQDDYLQISVLEILAAWQAGFDKVNALYGTDIRVELNPALLDLLVGGKSDTSVTNDVVDNTDGTDTTDAKMDDSDRTDDNVSTVESEVDAEDGQIDTENIDTAEDIDTKNAVVEDMVDTINDTDNEEVDDNGSMERSSESEDVGDDKQD
jgi:hypothetical protein